MYLCVERKSLKLLKLPPPNIPGIGNDLGPPVAAPEVLADGKGGSYFIPPTEEKKKKKKKA